MNIVLENAELGGDISAAPDSPTRDSVEARKPDKLSTIPSGIHPKLCRLCSTSIFTYGITTDEQMKDATESFENFNQIDLR
jgi:hypothetical protein